MQVIIEQQPDGNHWLKIVGARGYVADGYAGPEVFKSPEAAQAYCQHFGYEVLCGKCQRPLSHWPLKRGAKCSEKWWARCIRPIEYVSRKKKVRVA
jgi:hypothetical protein